MAGRIAVVRWFRSSFGVVWAGLLLLVGGRAGWGQSESGWTEVRSPHFRVVTNGSANDGRKVAAEFEQMRYVLHYRIPSFRLEAGAPLLIVAAKDEATARELEPGLWVRAGPKPAGVFHAGWERNVTLVRLDQWKAGARSVVYHEYTHSVLHLNSRWLPHWLDEGLAEFFGYTRFEDRRILMGTVTDRWRTLGDQQISPVATLLTEKPKDYLGDDRKVQLFYAESWALVHYMTFGAGMENGRRLFAFFDKLQGGEAQGTAFREVFGDLAKFEVEFRRYLGSGRLDAGVLPVAPAIAPGEYTEKDLTLAEAAYEKGAYLIGSKDPRDGLAEMQQALRLDAGLAPAHEELGYLHYELGDMEGARREWAEAVRLNAALYRSAFALVMTEGMSEAQSAEGRGRVEGILASVLQRNGLYAPAHVEMAILLWRDGRLTQALDEASTAERLEPWRAGYHLLAGELLLANGDGVRAASVARYVAGLWTGTDRDEAVELWTKVPERERGGGPALSLEAPSGSKVVQGMVTAVTCRQAGMGGRMDIMVQPEGAGGLLLLHGGGGAMQMGFADTLWFGEDHLAFCREGVGLATTAAYRPTSAGEGELLWVDLRDALPSDAAANGQAALQGARSGGG